MWDTQNRKEVKVSLLYCLHPFYLRFILFSFHSVCVRFARSVEPPTASFGNVSGCGRQMGSLALLSSCLSSFVCRTRGKVCVYIYVALCVLSWWICAVECWRAIGCIWVWSRIFDEHRRRLVSTTPVLLRISSALACLAVLMGKVCPSYECGGWLTWSEPLTTRRGLRGCMSAYYYWVFHNNVYNRLSDCFRRSWNFYGLVFLFCAVVWGTRAYVHTDLQAARSGMNARLIYYYGVFVSIYFHYYYYYYYYYLNFFFVDMFGFY